MFEFSYSGDKLVLGETPFLLSSEVFLVRSKRIVVTIYQDSYFVPLSAIGYKKGIVKGAHARLPPRNRNASIFERKRREIGGIFIGHGDYTVKVGRGLSGKFEMAWVKTHPKDWKKFDIYSSLTEFRMHDALHREGDEKGIIQRAQRLVETNDWKEYQCNCPEGYWSMGLGDGVEVLLDLEPGSQYIDINGASTLIEIEHGKVVMYTNTRSD